MATPQSPLKAVVIEDEFHFLQSIETMLSNFSHIDLMATAGTVDDGIKVLDEVQPDIVFMDVELNGGSGFDILETIEKPEFDVIFTTAHEHYALNAIRLSALDYLLKPFGLDELAASLTKLDEKRNYAVPAVHNLIGNLLQNNHQKKKIGLATQEGISFVQLSEILWYKAESNYSLFHLINKEKIIISSPLKKYAELLEQHGFFRVHQSYLINLHHVSKYLKVDGGIVLMADGTEIPIARRRKDLFMEMLKQQGMI